MYGVSKITSAEDIMLVCFTGSTPSHMTEVLTTLAGSGIVVDMISQSAPLGKEIQFSFTAHNNHFNNTLKAIATIQHSSKTSPLISGGYSKINLYGEEMVDSVGVAARALSALDKEHIEIMMITTSDLDISLLVRREDTDIALQTLSASFAL